MKIRLGRFAGIIGAALLAASAASAEPFTYQFIMPAWDTTSDPALFGTNAVLDLTLDNGGLSDKDQSYTFSDITSATVTAQGGTFDQTWTSSDWLDGEHLATTFLVTNGLGAPTLDLLMSPTAAATVYLYPSPADISLQFGIIQYDGGSTPFAINENAGKLNAYIVGPSTCNIDCGFEVGGVDIANAGSPTGVPEPSSLPLMLAGLGLIGGAMYFGRKKIAPAKA